MKLSVIILNYKTKNLTKQCIKNIESSDLALEYEIIVVDNNSRDGIKQMMQKEFPKHKFISSEINLGMGGGNNLGIQRANGQYILVINSDVVVFKESIKKLINFMDSHDRAGVVAPRVLNPDKTIVDSCCRWPNLDTFVYRRTFLGTTRKGKKELAHYLYKNEDLSVPKQVDWIFGCSLLFRKQALNEVGSFDKRFFLFLEETDLCRRMWQKKWQVWYVPESQIVHYPHRRTMGTGKIKDMFSKYTWIHLYSWIKYFIKWRKNK
ncbi:MAG: glycosyltransferase family 2 protein [Patescibacteria group bacterium]